ncbi:hypothetical protein D3C80_1416820 [compost metagenome]
MCTPCSVLSASGCDALITATSGSRNNSVATNPSGNGIGRISPTSMDSSNTPSATSRLLISLRFRCTAGKRWRKAWMALGIFEVNGADDVKPIFISPSSPSCARRATSAAFSTCDSTWRASSRNSRPASLSSTRRLVRSNNRAPSSCSRAWICWLRGGWEMPSCWAARPKCSSSATAMK